MSRTIIVLVAIVLIKVFFGYWRGGTRRFSRQWLMAIHIPVPLVIGLRLSFLGWNWLLLPVFVGAFAVGQYSGGQLRNVMKKPGTSPSPFLGTDIYRALIRDKPR